MKLFDVNIITIDDKSETMKDVRQISLSSGRLILVDKEGQHKMYNPEIIDCMNMFNTTYYNEQIMKAREPDDFITGRDVDFNLLNS